MPLTLSTTMVHEHADPLGKKHTFSRATKDASARRSSDTGQWSMSSHPVMMLPFQLRHEVVCPSRAYMS
jgi:hypothetical protein